MTPGPPRHFVYIVRCADGSFYTGYARDPEARLAAHNSGRGAKYTATRRPVTLVYLEEVESTGAALKREHRVKCLPRMKKEALVAGFTARQTAPAASPPTDRIPARRRRGRTTRTSPPQA